MLHASRLKSPRLRRRTGRAQERSKSISWQFDVTDTAFIIICHIAIDTAKGLKFVAPPKEALAGRQEMGVRNFPLSCEE